MIINVYGAHLRISYEEASPECQAAVRSLVELLDSSCDESKRHELERQVQQCPHCFQQLNIEQQVRELVKRSCHKEAPYRLKEMIIEKLHAEWVDGEQ